MSPRNPGMTNEKEARPYDTLWISAFAAMTGRILDSAPVFTGVTRRNDERVTMQIFLIYFFFFIVCLNLMDS